MVKGNETLFEWDDQSSWDYENWQPGFFIAKKECLCTKESDIGLSSCVFMGENINGLSPEEWHDGYCNSSGALWDCICKKNIFTRTLGK